MESIYVEAHRINKDFFQREKRFTYSILGSLKLRLKDISLTGGAG